jgi:hypothetical protein
LAAAEDSEYRVTAPTNVPSMTEILRGGPLPDGSSRWLSRDGHAPLHHVKFPDKNDQNNWFAGIGRVDGGSMTMIGFSALVLPSRAAA